MTRWTLTGTEAQKAIARQAFERIKFPFELLTMLPGSPELGWRDLNARYAEEASREHAGHHPTEDKADTLAGEMDGRKFTMGVIYTLSGRIYIDIRLINRPLLAMTVIAAEIAHAVDFFLPMTDHQRNTFLELWGVGGTWWEVQDYGSEYFTLGGEAFMREFTQAYSNLDYNSISGFKHDLGVEPEDVIKVLGIQRTDYVAPPVYEQFGKSTIYHKTTHYKHPGNNVVDLSGLRPCKVCKP